MNNKVLACTDHSAYAPAVCDLASWAAQRLAAPLEFIHVLDRHPEIAPKYDLSGSIGLGAQEALLGSCPHWMSKEASWRWKAGACC